jgi:hypothetical protein
VGVIVNVTQLPVQPGVVGKAPVLPVTAQVNVATKPQFGVFTSTGDPMLPVTASVAEAWDTTTVEAVEPALPK